MPKLFDPHFDPTPYQRLAAGAAEWRLRDTLVVQPLKGGAIVVRKGEVLRVGQPDGPQVVDFNAFSFDDPDEYFWSGRTRILEAPHLTAFNRLWSIRVRPMFTIIGDTVKQMPSPRGGRNHDLLFARCSRELYQVVDGRTDAPNCQDNIASAIAPFGLGPRNVHDAFNLFTKTGIDPSDHHLFIEECDSRQGDYVDLYAEMDCIVALSACPSGDGSEYLPTPPPVRSIRAEVFELPGAAGAGR